MFSLSGKVRIYTLLKWSGTYLMVDPDMSIWEVRNNKQNFVYSKIMLWVAFDRGLRLAEKRCLPCPNRAAWLAARDEIYEDIMTKGTLTSPLKSYIIDETPKATAAICDVSSKATKVAML